MKLKVPFLLAIIFVLSLSNCTKEEVKVQYRYFTDDDYKLVSQYLDIPNAPVDYSINFPSYYSSRPLEFNNGMATLGRALFYDKNL